MTIRELAEWFGFELSKLAVDECLGVESGPRTISSERGGSGIGL